MTFKKIKLKKDKDFSIKRRHPWIFSGAIAGKEGDPAEGETVEVFAADGGYLATGHYAGGSIAVRIFSFERTGAGSAYWQQKISEAWNYRQSWNLPNPDTNCFRLFFGEADGVPGLVLDYFDGHVVLQAHSYGVYLVRKEIATALEQVLGNRLKSVYDKSAETLSRQFSQTQQNQFLFGEAPAELIVSENGKKFIIDTATGQKTGFFLDQRDNRSLLQGFSKDKMVLNTFSYTGGFSVFAAGSARGVVSVDVSKPAIELCRRNIELNGYTNHECVTADTFDYLRDHGSLFDLIVLDPPAFAKSRDSKHNAVIGYKRLNTLAIRQIKPGGIIFTFSCSGVVDKFLFYNTINASAYEAGRTVRILRYLSQPADHPTTPFFPEGEYLKGMVLRVD